MASPNFEIGVSCVVDIPAIRGSSSSGTTMCENKIVLDMEQLQIDDSTQILVDRLNSECDVTEGPIPSQAVVVNVQGRAPFEFLEEDVSFQKAVAEGGSNPSASVNNWAKNRVDKFRKFKGLNCDIPFKELPPVECSKLLTKFFEQVVKKNGSLYPSQTLMGLYRAFGRILRRSQECRIQKTGVDEPAFCMRTNPMFRQVGVACVLAMERSKKAGANQARKKSSIITLTDEQTILAHPFTSPQHARGLQRRAVFYLLCRFAIRGGMELYKLQKDEFCFGSDEAGSFVQYDERLSKNYRVSLDRYQEEHFRPSVSEHDSDMILTMKSLIDHLPVSGIFLFYQCIDNPRTHAWYSTLWVAAKTLTGCLKEIHRECGLITEGVMNKSGRTTCVTRMATEGVPPAVGMRITGHKSQGAYSRYDHSSEAQVRAAQKCAGEASAYNSNVLKESGLFKNKVIAGSEEGADMESDISPTKRAKMDSKDSEGSTAGVGCDHVIPVLSKEIVEYNDAAKMLDAADRNTEEEEMEWLNTVDWDGIMREWDQPRVVRDINPIKNVLGRISQMTNCIVNINIGSMPAS